MITLFLFGGSILLWVVIHLINRVRRAKVNPYDRFLKDRHVEAVRIEDMRSYKLRMATHGNKAMVDSPSPCEHLSGQPDAKPDS